MRSVLLVPAAVATCFLAGLVVVGTDGFWIGDNAVKFLQVEAQVERGVGRADLEWAGRDLDPELRHNPLPAPFTLAHDGRLQAQYSPVFAALTVVPFRLLGPAGLYLLPFLGAVAAAFGARELARAIGEDARGAALAMALAGLATPMWFYATTFWEHTPALACVLFATALHLRGGSAAAQGVWAAAAVWFREEQLLFVALLGAALLVRRPRALLAFGGAVAAVLLPQAAFLHYATGSPVGLHAAANLGGEYLGTRLAVARRLWTATGDPAFLEWAWALPALALLAASPRLGRPWFGRGVAVVAFVSAAATAVVLVRLFGGDSPIRALLASNSLLPAAPIVVLAGLLPADADPRRARLTRLALGYGALYTALAPAVSSGGVHWGCRFLLPLYPLLAVGAAATVRRAGGAAAVVVAVSVLAQLGSLWLLDAKKDFSRRLRAEVERAAPDVIVTDRWWVGAELYPWYGKIPVLYVRSREELGTLVRRLDGSERVWLVGAGPATPDAVRVEDATLRFFGLTLRPVLGS